jgi:uncharacterized protein YabE (DUF348 family)
MKNHNCNINGTIENINGTIENINDVIEKNNIKLDIYNKYMDELITNFHLLNLKFFNS